MIYFTRTAGVSPKKVTRHVTLEVKMNHPTVHRSHPKAEVPSNEALLLGKRWSWELVSMVDIAWWCHLQNLQNYTPLTISKIVWSHLAGDTVWYCMILTSFFQDLTHNDLQWSLNTSSWSYWVTPSERLWGTLSRLGFLSGCINTCHIPNKWINSCITLSEEKKGLQITMCLMIMVRSWTNTKKG